MFYVGLVQLMLQLFEAVKVTIQVTTQTSNIKVSISTVGSSRA